MKTFNVLVARTTYSMKNYVVQADSADEAGEIAEDMAADEDWTGCNHSVEYESEVVDENEEEK
jgi:hypothetical protein